RDLLPAPAAAQAAPGTAPAEAGAVAGRAAGGVGETARGPLHRPGAHGDLRPAPRRGAAPVLDPDDVPGPGGERGGARASAAAPARALLQTGTAGDGAEPGVELGHHEAARAGEVDVLLPLRPARHLQPLRRGLAGRREGIGS